MTEVKQPFLAPSWMTYPSDPFSNPSSPQPRSLAGTRLATHRLQAMLLSSRVCGTATVDLKMGTHMKGPLPRKTSCRRRSLRAAMQRRLSLYTIYEDASDSSSTESSISPYALAFPALVAASDLYNTPYDSVHYRRAYERLRALSTPSLDSISSKKQPLEVSVEIKPLSPSSSSVASSDQFSDLDFAPKVKGSRGAGTSRKLEATDRALRHARDKPLKLLCQGLGRLARYWRSPKKDMDR